MKNICVRILNSGVMIRIRCNLFYTILNCDDPAILLFQYLSCLSYRSIDLRYPCSLNWLFSVLFSENYQLAPFQMIFYY
ncbi:hypothetical protein VNO77_30313 [Canavalia gladiata]|uniref:Uncharacterized protein n=1 Tax=Canavalia gladiata TaxID=3824 RepID=A0AAN9KRE6_CANGL